MAAHIVPEELWWTDRQNLASVVDWADEVGEFSTLRQVVHFLEKPYLYEDMWFELRASLENDHDTLERMKGEL